LDKPNDGVDKAISPLPQLAAIKLARYGEDLLFYLYYMNGGDLLQLLAAVEL
jgi:CCR4-NOT transcriptional regulation complex NOT5 subunit